MNESDARGEDDGTGRDTCAGTGTYNSSKLVNSRHHQ